MSGESSSTTTPSSPPAPAPAGPAPIRRWRWWLHLLLIAAYPVWIGILSLEDNAGSAPALASTTWGLVVVSVLGLLLFGIVFGGAWLASRASGDALLLRWRRGFWPVPWGLGYSVALRLGIAILALGAGVGLVALRVVTVDELAAFSQRNQPDVEAIVDVDALRDNPAYFWLMVTFVSFVVAGLREELWRAAFLAGMRALWPQSFASRRAQIGAVAMAAVMFGFGHAVQGPIAAAMAGLLGFGLGVIMIVHRSIWPAVIAHGFFDATSFALIPFAMEKLRAMQSTLGP